MSRADPTEIVSNWNTMIPGMKHSSDQFYGEVTRLIGEHQLKDVKIDRVNIAEGGVFSARREYLQVKRDNMVFHVCAAPFGNGFFVSYWFGTLEKGWIALIRRIPFMGSFLSFLIKPWTYFRADTANMFNAITSGAVQGALDGVVKAQGLRSLTPEERKPVMRDLFR